MRYLDLWPLIQQDILCVIAADPDLGTRKGVAVEPGDIQSKIDAKLAQVVGAGLDGKNGVGYLVLPIERAEDTNASLPFGPLKLTISVQWCENVIINNSTTGTGIPIRVWAALTAKVLKLYTPVNLASSLVAANPVIYEFTDDRNKNLRVGMVEFTTLEADDKVVNRLPRPQLTQSGSGYPYTVTVSAPNAMAVYYTTDGSHPYDGNATATLYNGSIAIPAACLLRVRAIADGS